MGDNRNLASVGLRVHHGGCNGHQLCAAVAPYDAGLAEQGVDSLVRRRKRPCVRGSGAASGLTVASLYGSYLGTFGYERFGVLGKLCGVVHALDVQHDYRRALAVYVCLVHVFKGVLYAYLGAVADGEYLIEMQAELHGCLKDEYDGGSGT